MSSRRTQVCECTRPKCSDFGLGGVSPTVFVKLQCRAPDVVLLLYRLLVTLYMFGYFLYVFIVSVRPGSTYGGYFFIYLTNWGFMLMLAYLFCALWNQIAYMALMKSNGWTEEDDVPWYFFQRGQWLFFNMYATVALLISIVYWGALYYPEANLYYDINFHTLTSVFALVEILLTAMVIRLLHFIYPFIFGSVYLVFTGIYYAAGGTDETGAPYVYPILDYGGKPSLAVGLALGILVATALVHVLLVWGVHKLKLLICVKCCPSCYQADDREIEKREEGVVMM